MYYYSDFLAEQKKNNDELTHYGIKGMRWGVRRFQNEDGSLTPAGESRYNRGKRLDVERRAIVSDTIKRLKKSSEKYKHHNDEIERLGTKYTNLLKKNDKQHFDSHYTGSKYDPNDPVFNNSKLFDQKMVQKDRQIYDKHIREMQKMNSEFASKAEREAIKTITKKYGNTAVEDVETFNKAYDKKLENATRALIIGAAALPAAIAFVNLMTYESPASKFDARAYVQKANANTFTKDYYKYYR